MPEIQLQRVVSVSSEDPEFPAIGLIGGKNKWKTKKSDSSTEARVILALEEPSSFKSIHLGNHGSAFIEVKVGRSADPDLDSFCTLLPRTQLMGNLESRNEENIGSVKAFTADKLAPSIASQTWDRICIECQQHFNPRMQFGLSFINFFSPPNGPVVKNGSEDGPSSSLALGGFLLKKTSPEEEEERNPVSVFQKHQKKFQETKKIAEEIRQSTSSAEGMTKRTQIMGDYLPTKKPKTEEENDREGSASPTLLASSPAKLNSQTSTSQEPSKTSQEVRKTPKPPSKTSSNSQSSSGSSQNGGASTSGATPKPPSKTTSNTSRDSSEERRTPSTSEDVRKTPSAARGSSKTSSQDEEPSCAPSTSRGTAAAETSTPGKRRNRNRAARPVNRHMHRAAGQIRTRRRVPFNQLLKGFNFVLSGYQNPLRSQLRDMAVEMGAWYSPNWGPSQNILVCAFSNTPKFQEVLRSGHGRVVSEAWIQDCYRRRRRLNWRDYSLRTSEVEVGMEEVLLADDAMEDDAEDESEGLDILDVVDDEEDEWRPSGGEEEATEEWEDDVVPEDDEDLEEEEDEDTDDELERRRTGKKRKQEDKKKKKKEDKKKKKQRKDDESPKKKKKKADTKEEDAGKKEKQARRKEGEAEQEEEKPERKGKEPATSRSEPQAVSFDWDAETDPEDEGDQTQPLKANEDSPPPLPDFFLGERIYIDEASVPEARTLSRLVTAYGGTVQKQLQDDTDFAVVDPESYPSSLKDVSVTLVSYKWILKCHEEQKRVEPHPWIIC